MLYALARPAAYAFECNIIDLSGFREQIEDFTRDWEKSGSAFLLQRISYTKLSKGVPTARGVIFKKIVFARLLGRQGTKGAPG